MGGNWFLMSWTLFSFKLWSSVLSEIQALLKKEKKEKALANKEQ
jgi:hypothetical protein